MKNKKSIKKSTLSKALALVVVAAVSVGATYAYLTDKQSVTNTFTVGNVQIEVKEPAWGTTGTTHEIAPGVEVAKDPSVKNTGENTCWIRVKVNYDKNVFEIPDLNLGKEANKWTFNDKDQYYYYNSKVEKNGETTKLFNKVKMKTTVKESGDTLKDKLNVIVNAEAVQADGFNNYTEAFNAANTQLAEK